MATQKLRRSVRGTPLRRWLLGAACVLAASVCSGTLSAPPAAEYQVKAAYLFNFGQFVEWPQHAYASPAAPFVIGIVGEDPFGKTLDDVIAGESFGGRPLVVRRFGSSEDISACNILFIGSSEAGRLEKLLKLLQGRSVLTVTDIAGAERRGAIIALYNENKRIRMRINVAAARASNLVISSKLLRPAEIVGGDGG
ncbi:MAG TPA: YfiR family protein [Steroidobacteraceae bacterium]|nr:YfiR family protein [Steroidobacteraceae bacterium]